MSVTRTFSTNMTCGTCLSKVRPLLDDETEIQAWTADLDDPRKTIQATFKSEQHEYLVPELLNRAGFAAQVIEANQDLPSQDTLAPQTVSIAAPARLRESAKQASFEWSNYKPLLIVIGYVLGLTALMEWTLIDQTSKTFDPKRAMTHFMGFFFLGFAFFKLLNVSKFADAFAMYDIIAKRSRVYALAYPFIELGLGLLFVTRTGLPLANIVTVIVMSVGLIGVISAVRKEQAIQCACLGTAFNLPMSVVTIIENSVMIVMAISMLALNALPHG